MLDSTQVPITQSALLVVDAQDSFKVTPRWERRNNPDFEKNVAALIATHRAANLPVVFFLHTDSDEGFATDSPFFKLMDFIQPRGGDPSSSRTLAIVSPALRCNLTCWKRECAELPLPASRWSNAAKPPPGLRPISDTRWTSSPKRL
jgi:hypothetical protein